MLCTYAQDMTYWFSHRLHETIKHSRRFSLQNTLPNLNTAVDGHGHVREHWPGNSTVLGFVDVHSGIHLGGYTREAG
jgi:hypothetical protein